MYLVVDQFLLILRIPASHTRLSMLLFCPPRIGSDCLQWGESSQVWMLDIWEPWSMRLPGIWPSNMPCPRMPLPMDCLWLTQPSLPSSHTVHPSWWPPSVKFRDTEVSRVFVTTWSILTGAQPWMVITDGWLLTTLTVSPLPELHWPGILFPPPDTSLSTCTRTRATMTTLSPFSLSSGDSLLTMTSHSPPRQRYRKVFLIFAVTPHKLFISHFPTDLLSFRIQEPARLLSVVMEVSMLSIQTVFQLIFLMTIISTNCTREDAWTLSEQKLDSDTTVVLDPENSSMKSPPFLMQEPSTPTALKNWNLSDCIKTDSWKPCQFSPNSTCVTCCRSSLSHPMRDALDQVIRLQLSV